MKIGIIGATEHEIMPLINKLENKEIVKHAMSTYYLGTFGSVSVAAVMSGVCKVNAAVTAQVLIDKFQADKIIMTGVAGALNDKLHVGDVVIANELVYHDVAPEILTEYHPYFEDTYFKPDKEMVEACIGIAEVLDIKDKYYVGRIITGEAFITDKERDHLIKRFEPLCVDMESASVAHVCTMNSIPFTIIRSMSDSADEEGFESFENNVKTAALNSLALVEGLLQQIASNR